MEGVTFAAAALALAVAMVAIALVVRAERRPPDAAPGIARAAELERRVAQLGLRLDAMERDVDEMRRATPSGSPAAAPAVPRGAAAISRIGLVRFDAFEDTGGAQSFALALMDDDGDGIVLTSLHSRPTTRVYLKAIRRGVADAPLSAEETRALRDAGITPSV
jgi:hypothetical protein